MGFIFREACLNPAASPRSEADRFDAPCRPARPITSTVARIFCTEGSACQAKTASCAPLMHVPPGTKVDPANEIGGCYRYAVSRRESAVDLVLKFAV